jgi:hypothetical protein
LSKIFRNNGLIPPTQSSKVPEIAEFTVADRLSGHTSSVALFMSIQSQGKRAGFAVSRAV